MLTRFETSLIMQRYLCSAVDFMKKNCHILPTLFVLNRGNDLNINIKHPNVLEIKTETIISDTDEAIYKTGSSTPTNPLLKKERS